MKWNFPNSGAGCNWTEITESSQQNMSSLKLPKVGLEEIKNEKVAFAKELAAEFLGTMLLVMIGCGSAMSGDGDDGEGQLGVFLLNLEGLELLYLFHFSGEQAQYVRIALAFGLAVATIAQAFTRTLFCKEFLLHLLYLS